MFHLVVPSALAARCSLLVERHAQTAERHFDCTPPSHRSLRTLAQLSQLTDPAPRTSAHRPSIHLTPRVNRARFVRKSLCFRSAHGCLPRHCNVPAGRRQGGRSSKAGRSRIARPYSTTWSTTTAARHPYHLARAVRAAHSVSVHIRVNRGGVWPLCATLT